MNKYLNIVSQFKAAEGDSGEVKIRGMASTANMDRVGDNILSTAWSKGGLDNFNKNPIILFNHNYDSPIGKATLVEPVENGLRLEATLSAHAPNNVAGLVKDGVLGAFSVGFIIKDADYNDKTGGLEIKDAELLEVSVVSVPCNQDATFSVVKSFDSKKEYREFLNSLGTETSNNVNTLKEADLPKKGEDSSKVEIDMDPKDLEALLEKQAERVATKIKMEQAAKDAADKKKAEEAAAAAKAKADSDAEIEAKISVRVQEGVEKLMADFETRCKEMDSVQEAYNSLKSQLDEKVEEIAKMQDSKRFFEDRKGQAGDHKPYLRELAEAKLYSVIKGIDMKDNPLYQAVAEKAGLGTASIGSMDDDIIAQIEKEIQLETRVAGLFREMPVRTGNTTMTIQLDSGRAVWQATAAASGNLTDRAAGTANTYVPTEVTMIAERLISSTYLDDNTDEQFLPNFMPMLLDSVVRAHARAVDYAFIAGNGSNIAGLDGAAAATAAHQISIGGSEILDGSDLLDARQQMGRYGVSPSDIVYIVNVDEYLNLMDDTDFHDIQQIGSDAVKLNGQIGRIWGSPVIVSDEFPTAANGAPAAFAVYTRNFVVPRLKGITLETDREVANQRNFIVAAQSLGLTELVDGAAGAYSTSKVDYVT